MKLWICGLAVAMALGEGMASELSVKEPVLAPIHYGNRKGERELFGYNPVFKPNVVTFDLRNKPYIRIRNDGRGPHGLPGGTLLQTVDSHGDWIVLDIWERIENRPTGHWAEKFRYEVIFDGQGDAYLLVDGTGEVDGVWTWLLHSTDRCRSWHAYPLPLPKIPPITNPAFPDYTTKHIRPIIERPNGSNLKNTPPAIVGSDGKYLLLVASERRADGTLRFTKPIRIEKVAGDENAPINVNWCGDWGNFGNFFVMHEPVVSSDKNIHLFWGRPWPVKGEQGTPMYAATYDRKTGKVSKPVYLGSNGHQIDGHDRPAAAIDKNGCLHVILGCHATIEHPHEQLKYVRSLKPDDTSAGFTQPVELPIPARGEIKGDPGGSSYPSMVCDDNGVLHVFGRQYDVAAYVAPGIYTTPEGLLLSHSRLAYYRKKPGQPWEYKYLVCNYHPAYSLWYHKVTKDRKDRLFLSYMHTSHAFNKSIRHGPNLMISDDGGDQWRLCTSPDLGARPRVVPAGNEAEQSVRETDTMLTDKEFFQALDLDFPGLEKVAGALKKDDCSAAIGALCTYYRNRKGEFWWKNLYPPLEKKKTRQDYHNEYLALKNHAGAYGSSHWNADGSYDWINESKTNMSHRMYFFSALAGDYEYTGDEEVVRLWSRLLRDWIRQNPPDSQLPSWLTMNIGIRIRTGWGDAFAQFVHSPALDNETLFLFFKSYYEQAAYLRKHHSKTSNWLTFEMAGLYSAGILFPEFKASADWRHHAEETALADLDKGWLPDGMSVELTPGYGQFFSNYLKMHRLAKETGHCDRLLETLVRRCERLYDPYVRIMAPDGFTPAFNDNKPVEYSSRFLQGATNYYPHREDFRWIVTRGKEGSPPDYTSTVFPYAGYLVVRSGWETNANFFCFDAGPVGYRHAHQDKLNVVLWSYGRQILYDPGREAYADTPHQQYCMDTFSHSTGLVDNRPQRRVWYRNPSPKNMPYKKAEGFRYEIGKDSAWGVGVYNESYGRQGSVGTDSYPYKKDGNFKQDWCRPARQERQVAWLAPDIFVVQDRFVPNDSKSHRYEIRWQIDSLKLKQHGKWFETTDEGKPNLAVVPIEITGLDVAAASAQDKPEILGWKVKDKSYPATTLRHIRKGKGERGFLTLLLPLKPGQRADGITGKKNADGSFSIVLNDGRRLQIVPASGKNGRLVLTEK